jgi:hypothetical protein
MKGSDGMMRLRIAGREMEAVEFKLIRYRHLFTDQKEEYLLLDDLGDRHYLYLIKRLQDKERLEFIYVGKVDELEEWQPLPGIHYMGPATTPPK